MAVNNALVEADLSVVAGRMQARRMEEAGRKVSGAVTMWATSCQTTCRVVHDYLKEITDEDGNDFDTWWAAWAVTELGGEDFCPRHTARVVAAVCHYFRKTYSEDTPRWEVAAELLRALRHHLFYAAIEFPDNSCVMDPAAVEDHADTFGRLVESRSAPGSRFHRPASSVFHAIADSGFQGSAQDLVLRILRRVIAALPLRRCVYTVMIIEGLAGDSILAGQYNPGRAPSASEWLDLYPSMLEDPLPRKDLFMFLEEMLWMNNCMLCCLEGVPSPGLQVLPGWDLNGKVKNYRYAVPYLRASLEEFDKVMRLSEDCEDGRAVKSRVEELTTLCEPRADILEHTIQVLQNLPITTPSQDVEN